MRVVTDSKLRTKQNTRLLHWNNTLKFENSKQTLLLRRKLIDEKRFQDNLDELKRRQIKVRRQYTEMLHQKRG